MGPLALPLLWFHPTYKRTAKIIWTLIVLELTFILAKVTAASMHSLYQSYQQIMEAYKPLLN